MKFPFFKGKTHLDVLRERQQYLYAHQTGYELLARRFLNQLFEPVWPQYILGFYIVDYLLKNRPLVLEIDDPRHERADDYDDNRSRFLQSFGFEVFRIENRKISRHQIEKIVNQVPEIGQPQIVKMIEAVNKSPEVRHWWAIDAA